MTVKFEKITLWTATKTYGSTVSGGITALDHIIPTMDEHDVDCKILDYDAEDYKLVKVEKAKAKGGK